MTVNIGGIEVQFIEYRPGDGLVVRVADESPSPGDLAAMEAGLDDALRQSPHRIYRVCCDSSPKSAHAEGCESAPSKGKR